MIGERGEEGLKHNGVFSEDDRSKTKRGNKVEQVNAETERKQGRSGENSSRSDAYGGRTAPSAPGLKKVPAIFE